MWDEKYNDEEYVYGTEPNDFLKEHVEQLPKGRVLCLADDEGRNSVFLAEQGFDVTAVDASSVGLNKAQQLASERGVKITTQVVDLAEFSWEADAWDAIVSIFCHLPPPLRAKVHSGVVQSLRPGGTFLLEAYTPKQLEWKTGGPPVAALMMELAPLKQELSGLEVTHGVEVERYIEEGKGHKGQSAVVQFIAKKPA